MKTITIRNHETHAVIFLGLFENMRQCAEAAIEQGLSLAHADFRHADLRGATLDGGDFEGADFTNANLTAANLSETNLTDARMHETDLTAACLCEARLIQVDFTGASFGATLLAGATMEGCIFSCPSALALPFRDALLGTNTYHHEGVQLSFSAAPVVITGLAQRLVFLDFFALIGNRLLPCQSLPETVKTMNRWGEQMLGTSAH